MPSFEGAFATTRGQPIVYKGRKLHLVDRIELRKSKLVKLQVLSTNSEWEQGVSVNSNRRLRVGDSVGRKFAFWEEYAREVVEITLVYRATAMLCVCNVWMQPVVWMDRKPWMASCHHGAAMSIKDLGTERIYHCNDGHPDDNFDDIIFKISGIY